MSIKLEIEKMVNLEQMTDLKNKLISKITAYLKQYDWYELVDVVGNPEIDVEAREKLEEEISQAIETNDLAISDYFIEQIEEAKDKYQKMCARDILEIFWKYIAMARHIEL